MSSTPESAPREFANDTQYFLPKDALEHARLEAQQQNLLWLMDNKLVRAPLSNPKKILDIGSGTGAMTHLLGRMYPDAQVIGIDLAAVPEHIHGHLPNVTYIQGDISKLAGQDANLQFGSFDYVFERLLVLGMRNWPQHVALLTKLLRSGGWVEMQEIDLNLRSPTNEPMADKKLWIGALLEDCAGQGMDIEAASHLQGWLEGVSDVENVQAENFAVPATKEKGKEPLHDWVDRAAKAYTVAVTACCGPIRGKEEANKLVQQMPSDWDAGLEKGSHFDYWAVYGRKQ